MSSKLHRTFWCLMLLFAGLLGWLAARSAWFESTPVEQQQELFKQAQAALQLGKFDLAVRTLDELLQLNPHYDEAWLDRAQLYRMSSNDAAALTALSHIKAVSGEITATARHLEGLIEIERSHASAAERHFRESIHLHPEFIPSYEQLIRLYAMQFRRHELLTILESLARVRPLKLADHALTVTAGERLTPAAEAIPILQRFVEADPDDRASLMALGLYLNDDLQIDRAIATFRRLLSADPGHDGAKIALAQIHLDRQEYEFAADYLQQVTLDSQSPSRWWVTRGLWFVAAEDWPGAVTCFAEAADRDPFNRAAFNQLGLALHRTGHIDDANLALDRAVTLTRLREAFDSLGAMESRGQPTETMVRTVVSLFEDLRAEQQAKLWLAQVRQFEPDRSSPSRSHDGPVNSTEFMNRFLGEAPSIKKAGGTLRTIATPDDETPQFQLVDEAAARGINFQYANGATGAKYLVEGMGGGVGVIDFDADGWPDLFFPQGRSLPFFDEPPKPDRLYRNLGGERFVMVPDQAGVGDLRYGLGVAVGDIDNDGFDDLVVGNLGRNTLLRNQGDGTFADETEQAGLLAEEMTTSLGFSDIDRDGLLDLFVVNYVDGLKICHNDRGEISTCNPSQHSAVNDRVYRNLGDGRFEDLTREWGLSPGGKGLGIVLADLNDDGWPDAFVANDTTPNFLYLNRAASSSTGRQFAEVALPSGTALSEAGVAQAGMGVACGDLNGDLKLDLYVTYFYREANGLYFNEGQGLFREATRAARLYQPTIGMLGFGTQTVDFDLDGRPELFVANGHIDDLRASGIPWKMRPQLFSRTSAGHYAEVTAGAYFRGEYLGRGVARCDWNRDGRPDLVVVHQDRPVALLTNQSTNTGSAIKLRLRGTTSNRSAVGAKVLVTAGGRTFRVDLNGGDGYLCSNDRDLQIGLANATEVERLEIAWPSGQNDEHSALSTSSTWLIREGKTPVAQPTQRDSR